MKKLLTFILAIAMLTGVVFSSAEARTVNVRGYYRKSGAYVQSYHRTSPNSTKLDNWSTKGNYNPYTGKRGTVSPYKYYPKR